MIKFRELSESDLDFLNKVRNGYCDEFLHDSRKFTLSETKEWFNKTKPNFYMIEFEDKPIGYFRLSNHSVNNRNIYIGADISQEYKGKGFGVMSYRKFIPFLFEKYNLHKISLEVLSTNNIAINLYNKLGFVVEGIKRDDVLKNGKWIDSIVMSILENEYLK